ncbi:hypothetical protein RJ641_004565 [Dillenia turbinata]|uniref:Uncharacterized protein n=1 Tax=Dillenia turbinata TaxID=194707 RepID=A0AAN8VIC7_9MAGN
MAPAQVLADVDPRLAPESMPKLAADEEDGGFSVDIDDMDSECTSTLKDVSENEATLDVQKDASECDTDAEVDIEESGDASNIRFEKTEDPDATEYSSSFGDTNSGAETGFSDAEVESQLCNDLCFQPPFDGLSKEFRPRKRKLTKHWRNFIRPLMWRCQWLELKIKQIESQAAKYARELAAYDYNEQQLNHYTSEDVGSKSLPFWGHNQRRKAMRRRRRKRVEETIDVATYFSQHEIFSYFENKSFVPDGASSAVDCGNSGLSEQKTKGNEESNVDDNLTLKDPLGDDSFWETMLWKTEIVQARVCRLRSQLEMVTPEDVWSLSQVDNLSLSSTSDGEMNSIHSPILLDGNGDTTTGEGLLPSVPLVLEHINKNPLMQEDNMPSYQDAITVPDVVESTVGLSSATDVSLHQPILVDSYEQAIHSLNAQIVDNTLVLDKAAEGEDNVFSAIGNQHLEKSQEPPKDDKENTDCPQGPLPAPDIKGKAVLAPSTLSSHLASELQFPKNKRKRGERKAGIDAWSQNRAGKSYGQ